MPFIFLEGLGSPQIFLCISSANDDPNRRVKNEALAFARILPRRAILCYPEALVSKFRKKIEVEVTGINNLLI